MIASTFLFSFSMPMSAFFLRLGPSKAKGRVTTATVNALTSRAHSATTGAAPVPVPPPMPAVMKTISDPRRASRISLRLSGAARSPISGRAPAPSPRVNFSPICILFGDLLISNACESVLTAMNSTPSKPDSIILFTAFEPPPPMPITFIFAN